MNHDYGIDYGLGQSNVGKDGIRYGVIPMRDLAGWAWDEFEADYGVPSCPKCGMEAVEFDGEAHDALPSYTDWGCCDYVCEHCEIILDSADVYGDEPIGHTLNDGEYLAEVDSYGDAFVLSSPYYTHAQFCSPCAPGACHLSNPVDAGGPRAFCLGHEWFEDKKAPYPVFDVKTGNEVRPTEE